MTRISSLDALLNTVSYILPLLSYEFVIVLLTLEGHQNTIMAKRSVANRNAQYYDKVMVVSVKYKTAM